MSKYKHHRNYFDGVYTINCFKLLPAQLIGFVDNEYKGGDGIETSEEEQCVLSVERLAGLGLLL